MKWLAVTFSLLIIYGIDKKKYHILAIGLVLPIPALLTISIDYSLYGIIVPVLFYIRNKTNVFYKDIAVFMLIGIIALPLKSAVQLFAIFSVPIILMAEKFKCIRTSNKAIKQCYRCFYPAHMIFLLIIYKERYCNDLKS